MTRKNHSTNLLECQGLNPQVGGKTPSSRDAEIPKREWGEFLKSFSDQHDGWLVTVTLVSGTDKSIKATNCRLQGIVLIQEGSRLNIRISVVGAQGRPYVVHEVIDPVRITFKLDPLGAHEGLDITGTDHSITTIRFRKAVFPETLDGVLPEGHNVECK